MMFSVFPGWINIFWVLCIFILECSWEYFILFQFCCGEIFKKIHVSFFVSVLEMSLHFFYCSKKNQTSGFYSYTKTYYFIDITYSLILTTLLDYYLYRLKQTGYITANHTSSMQNNWELTRFWNVKFKVLSTTLKLPTKMKLIFF